MSLFYVDSTATGSNNGTSWANAWTSMDSITGVSGGDTVYISGGPSGSSQNYQINSIGGFAGIWLPPSGSTGNPITYKIGQDAGHNGTAIFVGYDQYYWIGYQTTPHPHDIIISGDAGDGQKHFAITHYPNIGVCQGFANFRLSYVNCGNIPGGIDIDGTGVEIDNNYARCTDLSLDHFSGATINDSTFGASSFHHNEIYVPGDGTGIGADCLQWNGTGGFDIHDNYIAGYVAAYTGGQHMDGWQGQGGAKIRIYNNTVVGFGDYGIYGDCTTGLFTDLLIYNNVVIACGGGIIVGVDAGAPSDSTFTNVVIANNTVDSGTVSARQSFAFGNASAGHTASFVNCTAANNVIVGGEDFFFPNNSATTKTANVQRTTTQATTDFQSYAADSLLNNYRLQAAASALVGQGTNLFTYFTTDKAGLTRPASGAWDIGAYSLFLGLPGNVSRSSSTLFAL